jgi:hypothetical protein
MIRRELARGIVTSIIFLLSIGAAFINADVGKSFWLLLIPANLFIQ